MGDSTDRAERLVADRVAEFLRVNGEFAQIRDHLASDGVGGVAAIDQRGERRRHRDRVGGPDAVERWHFPERNQACRGQLTRPPQGSVLAAPRVVGLAVSALMAVRRHVEPGCLGGREAYPNQTRGNIPGRETALTLDRLANAPGI
jgi:hypothetical protein